MALALLVRVSAAFWLASAGLLCLSNGERPNKPAVPSEKPLFIRS